MESQVAVLSGRRRPPVPRSSLDRELLRRQLQVAWAESRGSESAFRVASVALFRAALEQGREQIKLALKNGGKGRACAEGLSGLQDQLVQAHIRNGKAYPAGRRGLIKSRYRRCWRLWARAARSGVGHRPALSAARHI